MRSMKRIFCLLLVCVLLLGSLPAASADTAELISNLTGEQMTLGEFAEYCVQYFELGSQTPAANPYSDLPQDEEQAAAILRLTALGALKGYPDGTVRPEETVDKVRAYTIATRLSTGGEQSKPFVTMPPDVTNEMCNAQFWLANITDRSRVLMDSKAIEALNLKTLHDPETNMFDLENFPATVKAQSVAQSAAQFETPSAHYLGTELMGEDYYQKLRDNVDAQSQPQTKYIKYGFTVRCTVMRGLPTPDALTSTLDNPEEDDFAIAALTLGEPLALYFTTADGVMTYAVCNHCCGWVPTKDIAVCRDRSEWMKAKNPRNFLIVTGEKVYMEPSADADLNEALLTMGAKLGIVANPARTVNWRSPMENYAVQVPCRKEDGSFYLKTALIASNRDVHVGYLPYTTENVLKQAFKCLGNRYSWGGGLHGVDCSQYIRELYRCFGFELPRNTTWQSKIKTAASLDWTGADQQKKCADLDTLRPGSILIWSAHEVLYLGKYNGRYYCISNVGKFIDPGKTEEGVIKVYGVVINELDIQRTNGETWLNSLTHVTVLQ